MSTLRLLLARERLSCCPCSGGEVALLFKDCGDTQGEAGEGTLWYPLLWTSSIPWDGGRGEGAPRGGRGEGEVKREDSLYTVLGLTGTVTGMLKPC